MKKIQATPTKQDLGALLGILFKISDEHACPLCMGVPPGGGGLVVDPLFKPQSRCLVWLPKNRAIFMKNSVSWKYKI